MFPSTTTDSPPRRSFGDFLRDALATTVEFATLGEATLDAAAPAKVRYVRADEVAAAPVPLPFSLLGAATPAARRPAGRAADAAPHPHRVALTRPARPRRPGAVPARAPVCTMPVAPVAAPRQPMSGPAPSVPPVAHRDLRS